MFRSPGFNAGIPWRHKLRGQDCTQGDTGSRCCSLWQPQLLQDAGSRTAWVAVWTKQPALFQEAGKKEECCPSCFCCRTLLQQSVSILQASAQAESTGT